MKKTFFICTIILIALWGCEKIELHPQNNQNLVTPTPISQNNFVLGKYKGISYSIKNMKKTLIKFGYKSKADNLEANLYYCAVIPDSQEDIAFLDTTTKILFLDYPIEYEVLQNGDYYIDSNTTDTVCATRYVLVEKIEDIPVSIEYDVKEELHYPENEEEAEAYLYNQLLFGEAQLPEGVDTAEYIEDNKGGWYPTIKLKFKNNSNLKEYNLGNMKIKIGIESGVTDTAGIYKCKIKHYGDINVSGFFQNDILTVRRGIIEWSSVDRYDEIKKDIAKPDNPNENIELTITKEKNNSNGMWDKANIFLAAKRYNDYCELYNIQKANNLNVWVTDSVGGSCPLFRRLGGVEFDLLKSYLTATILGVNFSTAFIMNLITKNLSPDITIGYRYYSKYMELTTFHELSHFSHAVKRGKLFWLNIVAGETANITATMFEPIKDPYRNGTQPTQTIANYIGLAESWAYFMEAKIGKYYGYDWNSSEFTDKELFKPITIPSEAWESSGWIPVGLYWDILDNTPNEIIYLRKNTLTGIIIYSEYDMLNGIGSNITVFNLYNLITNSNCNSITNFKTLFNNQYPNLTNQSNILFSLYGY